MGKIWDERGDCGDVAGTGPQRRNGNCYFDCLIFCNHYYEDFIALLKKLKTLLDTRFIKIMDEQLDVIPFEFSETFIDSFKLGAKTMAEVFRGE